MAQSEKTSGTCTQNEKAKSASSENKSGIYFTELMDNMMSKMNAVELSASVERNFLLQMIIHHEGAVKMAQYEIQNGTQPEMLNLAKGIIAKQKSEIAMMKEMLKAYPVIPGKCDPAYEKEMKKIMMDMIKAIPQTNKLYSNTDCNFAITMLPHHKAAVEMSEALLKFKPKGKIVSFAESIISAQNKEIELMKNFLKKNCDK